MKPKEYSKQFCLLKDKLGSIFWLSWKEEMLAKLKQEEQLTAWALSLQKSQRASRLKELRRKGLV